MDFLEEEFDEILNIFQIESEEIITRLNDSLLALEKKPSNKDAILAFFRDAHSLKGASRLIGFNNVQTIAHKMEDILGLAKDNKLQLNPKTVDFLYKTVDFLSDLIRKSIEQKHEIYCEEITQHVATLENITAFEQMQISNVKQDDFNGEIFKAKTTEINNLVVGCLYLLMTIESNQNPDLIQNLLENTKLLYELFEEIGHYEIKKGFEDIKIKLEFVEKFSNSLTQNEIEGIQLTINEIINDMNLISDVYSIPNVDYYSLAFEKTSQIPTNKTKEEPKEESLETSNVPESLGFSKIEETSEITEENVIIEEIISNEKINNNDDNLINIKNKFTYLAGNNNLAGEIVELLIEYKNNNINNDVKNILQEIIETLNFAIKMHAQLDEDIVLAFEQGLDYCEKVTNNSHQEADKELIFQRLEIIKKLIELKTEQGEDSIQLPKKGFTIKNRKITDFSQVFDSGEIKTLRVDSKKLDLLVNQVGELIITKIRSKKHLHELNKINKNMEDWQRNSIKTLNYLKYYEKKFFHAENPDNPMLFFIKQLLNTFSENNKHFQDTISNISSLYRTIQEDDTKMNLIVDDLEHMVKNVRVLPMATIFHLFGRMVRDIAQEKGKQIELEIVGSETSADKKVIEEIKTPLIHIIRNSIDHGIETPEERMAIGKNPAGKIILRAYPSSNNIIIEIHDDGKGINIEKIKEKALKNGYLSEDDINSMNDEQITNLIFAPGFSTGEEITNISGRGIGLDIVQTKIAQLNGKVKVISETNKGCCVQIELPTTMSTLKAFLVKIYDKTFAIPMSAINTVVWKKANEIITNKQNKTIIMNEKTIPLYYLSELLNLPHKKNPNRETILIIENDGKLIALAVDKLLGDQEILHKKLSAPLYRLKNISGITTLVSGEVCLILNVSDLIKSTANFELTKVSTQNISLIGKKKGDYKILLVDDSITTRTLEKNILTKAGYEIELATNPIEAFKKMKFMHFDLIISDIEMPEMNGYEFLQQLKTDEMYSEIPVIMVSSILNEEKRKELMKLGASDYIIKGDFSQEDFLVKVNSILDEIK